MSSIETIGISTWTDVHCPLCGSNDQVVALRGQSRYFGTSGHVTVKKCECGMLLTNPRPTGAALAALYADADYYTHGETSRIENIKRAARRKWQRWQMRGPLAEARLAIEKHTRIRRFVKRNALHAFPYSRGMRLLDFGCGDGRLLRIAQDLGLDAVGVEPDPQARQVALQEGVRVAETLEDADLFAPITYSIAKYDRIVLRHVLEHLPEPRETLRQLHKRMAPDARMLISVPNASSLQAQVFGEFWLGHDLPRHLWHYTPETLHRLLISVGLDPVESTTVELQTYAKLSSMQMVKETGTAPHYQPSDINKLETNALGTEIVVVVKSAG